MGYSIERFGHDVVGTVFEGNIAIEERLQALDALDQALEDLNPAGVLIDLRHASISQYTASDALHFSERIGDRPRPLRRIAYVLRPSQTDLLTSAVAGLYGSDTVRRFETREKALAWLGAFDATASKRHGG